jgi:hypothetical protein
MIAVTFFTRADHYSRSANGFLHELPLKIRGGPLPKLGPRHGLHNIAMVSIIRMYLHVCVQEHF